MSDLGNIIGIWGDGKNLEKRDDFASAAWLFCMYNIYYKNGELQMNGKNAVEKANKSYDKYC